MSFFFRPPRVIVTATISANVSGLIVLKSTALGDIVPVIARTSFPVFSATSFALLSNLRIIPCSDAHIALSSDCAAGLRIKSLPPSVSTGCSNSISSTRVIRFPVLVRSP